MVCSQNVLMSADRRKVSSLLENEAHSLWQLVLAEFPAEVSRLLSSHEYLYRPCFRALDTLSRQALRDKIWQCGPSHGLELPPVCMCVRALQQCLVHILSALPVRECQPSGRVILWQNHHPNASELHTTHQPDKL